MQRATVYSLSREVISRIGSLLLHDDYEEAPARKALVGLATTCRYFSEPLLDIIWRELPDVIPLLFLLPADLCMTTQEVPVERWFLPRREFVLLRHPTVNDFKRISVYSPRVKILGHECGSLVRFRHQDYKIPLEIWDMLAVHCPAPLLPNLVRLRCTAALPRIKFEFYKNFFQDYLANQPDNFDFSLGTCTQAASATEVVRQIARLTSRLRELYWFRHQAKQGIKGPDIRQLSSLSKLEAFEVAPDTLWAIGTLPCLRELKVRIDYSAPEWGDWNVFPHEPAAGLFPALEQLKLQAEGLLGLVAFLRTISSPSLVELSLQVKEDATPDVLLAAFCSAIGHSPFHGVLCSLELDLKNRCCGLEDASLRPSDTASALPLLSLRRLQTLRFEANFPMVFIDDALVEGMSRSWPDISVIQFHQVIKRSAVEHDMAHDPLIGAPGCPQATLACLPSLARRCLHLRELEIPIDMRIQWDRFDLKPGRSPPSQTDARESRLCTFSGEGCVMGDPWKVAAYLSLIFPHLKEIEYGNTCVEEWVLMEEIYEDLLRV